MDHRVACRDRGILKAAAVGLHEMDPLASAAPIDRHEISDKREEMSYRPHGRESADDVERVHKLRGDREKPRYGRDSLPVSDLEVWNPRAFCMSGDVQPGCRVCACIPGCEPLGSAWLCSVRRA